MVRSKIRTTQLLKRLDAHVHGDVDLTPSQVQAATFLVSMSLSKPAQDVAVTHDGELTIRWKS